VVAVDAVAIGHAVKPEILVPEHIVRDDEGILVRFLGLAGQGAGLGFHGEGLDELVLRGGGLVVLGEGWVAVAVLDLEELPHARRELLQVFEL
jgi:hypothetical protein